MLGLPIVHYKYISHFKFYCNFWIRDFTIKCCKTFFGECIIHNNFVPGNISLRVALMWHRNMMTSKMEAFSALLALCAWNSAVTGEFPTQRPVTRSFDVFFDLRLNKRLSKQSWGWWFKTPSRSLWRHCNEPAATTSRNCDIFTTGNVYCVSVKWMAKVVTLYISNAISTTKIIVFQFDFSWSLFLKVDIF